jgi:FAD synthase
VVEFISKLRDELNFDSLEKLQQQMAKDVARAKEILFNEI